MEQVYTSVRGFWLPVRNHGTSEIRLGGIAELPIDYSGYQILSPEDVNNVSALQAAQTPVLPAHDAACCSYPCKCTCDLANTFRVVRLGHARRSQHDELWLLFVPAAP